MDHAMFGTLNDQTTAKLRDRILSGDLLPGSRILETELADELGVSRGTLRAALQQLAFEGLVVQRRFRSTFVTSLSSKDAYEIYTLRNNLEAMATRLAAQRIGVEGKRKLDHAMDVMRAAAAAGNRKEVVEADYGFHRCLFEMSGHLRLQQHYRLIEPQTKLYLRLTATLEYDLAGIVQIHEDIARAVRLGRADEAHALASEHNTPDGEHMTDLLRRQEQDL